MTIKRRNDAKKGNVEFIHFMALVERWKCLLNETK